MFNLIAYSIVILKPTQAFLTILNKSILNSGGRQLSLDLIRTGAHSYLIPEIKEIEDGIKFVDDKFNYFFDLELSTWELDKSLLPEEPSLKLFWELFDVHVHPSLIEIDLDAEEQEATTLH